MDPEAAERRLVAIMFTDIVGYTALMEESEERGLGVRARHREAVQPLVARYGGEWIEETGDESLSCFQSAVDAVNCALAVQEKLRGDPELNVRIGIHLGETLFEAGRLYGDGVNVASRIRPLAEPGGVCVSAPVWDSIKNQENVESTEMGERELKNVARPVAVFAIGGTARPPAHAAPEIPSRSWRPMRMIVGLTGAALLVLGLGIWATWPRPLAAALDMAGLLAPPENPPLPRLPSIVVLPFTNMSEDPDQEYFADGMTEDLTTDLARNPYLFVISRSSAFTYKGRSVRVEDVGRELGVQYVLEGSVRRVGDRVRITAQLIDATSGFHLWSERYNRQVSGLFDLQAEISDSILGAVGVEIQETERERSRRRKIEDQTAYDLTARGFFHFLRFNRKDNAEARRLFTEAIALGAEDPSAFTGLGQTYALEKLMGWNLDPTLMDTAAELAQRAIAIDPSHPDAYTLMAQTHLSRGESLQAVAAARRGYELHPSADHTNAILGVSLLQNGEYLSGLQSIQRALRLNPRAPSVFWTFMAFANILANRFEDAVVLLERVRAAGPDDVIARVVLAMIYEASEEEGHTNHHAEAVAVAQEIRRINPELTAEQAVGLIPAGNLAPLLGPQGVAWLQRAGLP